MRSQMYGHSTPEYSLESVRLKRARYIKPVIHRSPKYKQRDPGKHGREEQNPNYLMRFDFEFHRSTSPKHAVRLIA
jgi:hypothetical protein